MQQRFYDLATHLTAKLAGDEVLLARLSGETSEFIRFNRSAVRQAGSVQQAFCFLELIRGRRHVKLAVTLSGEPDLDRRRAEDALRDLRDSIAHVPEDPHLLYATQVRSSASVGDDRLPDPGDVLDAICAAGIGRDLVGIYAQGGIQAGFANSLGQRNWFATYPFHFNWSFYLRDDKAVKTTYAGFEWDQQAFQAKVDAAAEQLEVLARPPKTIQPGRCRVYLAPAAAAEFMTMLCWGGFSLKAHRTKTTSLLKMIEAGARLHPSVHLCENTRDGMAPNFQSSGFIKPDEVRLIAAGAYRDCLVSPRSAKEYGVEPNGASIGEAPESLDMAGGDLDAADVPARLGTGVYVNQLWYLNYSDRPAGRITGMTRFTTFWVESGRIVAPLNVMRFDETVYRVLGENLLALTKQRDLIPSASTYFARSTGSMRLPGILVDDFTFTL